MHFTVFFLVLLVPSLFLGIRVARLCLVGNGREKCEAEPLDMRYQAEPGNEGFSPAKLFSSFFLLPSS